MIKLIKPLHNLLPLTSVLLTHNRNMSHKVFVYGTLKCDEPNHHWLTNPENGAGRFIAHGVTKTKFPLIIATKYNIPFLLYSPGKGYNVKGEVYEVDDLMLTKLDILEDHPKSYTRELDDVILVTNPSSDQQETVKCWIYFLKTFKPQLLERPAMADYSSKGPHGLIYCERSKREPNYHPNSELNDDDETPLQELLEDIK